jgi:hypothetical protein
MFARCLILLFVTTGLAKAQLSGRFYLDKETFTLGEPVFLYFEVINAGAGALKVVRANPYSFCSGYEIHVSSDENRTSACAAMGWAGSCLSSDVELKPGQQRVERILLNFDHKIGVAGDYDIQAKRSLAYADAGAGFFGPNSPKLEIHEQLHIRIDASANLDPRVFEKFVTQLHSSDAEKKSEAARTLATLAPKSLEETLLVFADDPQLRYFAPLAFHNLNTARSMSAMADLLRKSEVGSAENMDSAKYLAESDDPQWFPLLLEVAQKKPTIVNYVDDAAELGGAKMLPYLLVWLQSSDTDFTRPNAVTGMGYTGSREAIPQLIDVLRSPEQSISQRALWGLRQLTHFSVGGDHWLDQPQSQYSRWLQWWATNGTTAHVYKANECGDVRPLP